MASDRQSKRRRREVQPIAVPKQSRQASPKVLGAVGLLACVAALAIGLFAAFSRDSSNASAEPALAGTATVHRLFAGIPQHENVLGSRRAPVTVVEYVDLQCPYCKQFETSALPSLLQRFVRTGKAKLEARVIAFIGADSRRGREAVLAAGRQNRLFELAELLYYNQGTENTGWLSDKLIREAAANTPGLNADRLERDRRGAAVSEAGRRFDAAAATDSVQATPTILVGRTGGPLRPVRLASPFDSASVAAAIASSSP
jgi:protein-disulfide isomerase